MFYFKFNLTDKPSKPEGPIVVKEMQGDAVTIEWKPPSDNGGLDISKYSVEKCEADKGVWMKVAEVSKEVSSYCVQKLQEDNEYMFRVFAENPVGASEPLESEPIVLKSPTEVGKCNLFYTLFFLKGPETGILL